jgi:hypothetical protein
MAEETPFIAAQRGWEPRSVMRARYVPVSTGSEGQPRSLSEDQQGRRRSRHPQVTNDQRRRLPKLMATEQQRKQQRRRTTSDLRGPIRWANAQVTPKIRTASDDFEHP